MDKNSVTQKSSAFSNGIVQTGTRKLSGYRFAIPLTFVLAFILFFFSFCNFRYKDNQTIFLKGIYLVTGSHLKISGTNLINTSLMDYPDELESSIVIPANFWAILAFFSSIVGIIVFYKIRKKGSWLITLFGATGFISLVFLQLLIKDSIPDYAGELGIIKVGFPFAYWLCLISFLVAGALSFLRLKEESDKPVSKYGAFSTAQKTAPIQVNIITQQNSDTENNHT